MTTKLAELLRRPKGPSDGPYRIGVVTSTAPFLVRVGSAETATACARLTSYTPVLDDVVVVLVAGADRVVLGSTVAP